MSGDILFHISVLSDRSHARKKLNANTQNNTSPDSYREELGKKKSPAILRDFLHYRIIESTNR